MQRIRQNRWFKFLVVRVLITFIFTSTFQGISFADSSTLALNRSLHGPSLEEVITHIVRNMTESGESVEEIADRLKDWCESSEEIAFAEALPFGIQLDLTGDRGNVLITFTEVTSEESLSSNIAVQVYRNTPQSSLIECVYDDNGQEGTASIDTGDGVWPEPFDYSLAPISMRDVESKCQVIAHSSDLDLLQQTVIARGTLELLKRVKAVSQWPSEDAISVEINPDNTDFGGIGPATGGVVITLPHLQILNKRILGGVPTDELEKYLHTAMVDYSEAKLAYLIAHEMAHVILGIDREEAEDVEKHARVDARTAEIMWLLGFTDPDEIADICQDVLTNVEKKLEKDHSEEIKTRVTAIKYKVLGMRGTMPVYERQAFTELAGLHEINIPIKNPEMQKARRRAAARKIASTRGVGTLSERQENVAGFVLSTIETMKRTGRDDSDVVDVLNQDLSKLGGVVSVQGAGENAFKVSLSNNAGSFVIAYNPGSGEVGIGQEGEGFNYEMHDVAMDPQIAAADHTDIDTSTIHLVEEIADELDEVSPGLGQRVRDLLYDSDGKPRQNRHGRTLIGFVEGIKGFVGHAGKQGIHIDKRFKGKGKLKGLLRHEVLAYLFPYRHARIKKIEEEIEENPDTNNEAIQVAKILEVPYRTTPELKDERDWSETDTPGINIKGKLTKMTSSEKRLQRPDDYLVTLLEEGEGGVLLDAGPGFPPYPSAELADRVAEVRPGMKVRAVDIAKPAMVVRTTVCPPQSSGFVLIFDSNGELAAANSMPLSYTAEKFRKTKWYEPAMKIKDELIKQGDGASCEDGEGNSLIVDPYSDPKYSRDNLTYEEGDILEVPLGEGEVDVIRDFNMTSLYYTDPDKHQAMLEAEEKMLKENGHLMLGRSSPFGPTEECLVYRKRGGKLKPFSFVFSAHPEHFGNPGSMTGASDSFFKDNGELYNDYGTILASMISEVPEDERTNYWVTVDRAEFIQRIAAGLREQGYEVKVVGDHSIALNYRGGALKGVGAPAMASSEEEEEVKLSPLLAELVDRRLDYEKEEFLMKYGRQEAPQYVQDIFREIYGNEADQYELVVAPQWIGDGPNACAFRNTVVISPAFLSFVKYREELQAMLTHEVTHMKRRHALITESVLRREKDTSKNFGENVLASASTLRLGELEADLRPVFQEMEKKNLNPLGVVVLRERLKEYVESVGENGQAKSVAHFSLEEAALNAESVFYLYDIQALKHDLTEIPEGVKQELEVKKEPERNDFRMGLSTASKVANPDQVFQNRLEVARSLPLKHLAPAFRMIHEQEEGLVKFGGLEAEKDELKEKLRELEQRKDILEDDLQFADDDEEDDLDFADDDEEDDLDFADDDEEKRPTKKKIEKLIEEIIEEARPYREKLEKLEATTKNNEEISDILARRVNEELFSETSWPDPRRRAMARALYYGLYCGMHYLSGKPLRSKELSDAQKADIEHIKTPSDLRELLKMMRDEQFLSLPLPGTAVYPHVSKERFLANVLGQYMDALKFRTNPTEVKLTRCVKFAASLSKEIERFYNKCGAEAVDAKGRMSACAAYINSSIPDGFEEIKGKVWIESAKEDIKPSELSGVTVSARHLEDTAMLHEALGIVSDIAPIARPRKVFDIDNYEKVLARIQKFTDEQSLDAYGIARFFAHLTVPWLYPVAKTAEIEDHSGVGAHEELAYRYKDFNDRAKNYAVYRLFEEFTSKSDKFNALTPMERKTLMQQALLSLGYANNAVLLKDEEGAVHFEESDVGGAVPLEYYRLIVTDSEGSETEKPVLADVDMEYIRTKRLGAAKEWLEMDLTENDLIKIWEIYSNNPYYLVSLVAANPRSVPSPFDAERLFDRMLAKYLSKQKGWKGIFGAIKRLEANGVPALEVIRKRKGVFGLALAELWKNLPDKPTDEEMEEIRMTIGFVNAPYLRMLLQRYYYKKYFECFKSFEDRLDAFFSRRPGGFDYSAFIAFVKDEARSKEDFEAARKRVGNELDIFLQEGSAEVGATVLIDLASFNARRAEDLLIGSLNTSENDDAFRDVVYKNVEEHGAKHFSGPEERDLDFALLNTQEDAIMMVRRNITIAEAIINRVYNLSGLGKRAAVRKALTGSIGLVSNPKHRSRFLNRMIGAAITEEDSSQSEVKLRSVIEKTVGALGKCKSWKSVYFGIQSVLGDRMGIPPDESTDWQDIGSCDTHITELMEELDAEYTADDSIGIAITEDISSEPPTEAQVEAQWQHEPQTLNCSERILRESLAAKDVTIEREKDEDLSTLSFTITVAERTGALPVRFLQLSPQFMHLPGFEDDFSRVYDRVSGQSNIAAAGTIERTWPEFWDHVESFGEEIGGGSMATVFGAQMKKPWGQRKIKDAVVKVLNPNLDFIRERNKQFVNEVIEELEAQEGPQYGVARMVADRVDEWIANDARFKGFLADDAKFRERNHGFGVDGLKGSMYIPESFGPDNDRFILEERIHGTPLTGEGWKEITEKHDIKEVVSLILRNYIDQLTNGLIHSDVHIGNFMVMKNGDVAVLDRTFFLKLDGRPDDALRKLVNEVFLQPESIMAMQTQDLTQMLLERVKAVNESKETITPAEEERLQAACQKFAQELKKGDLSGAAGLIVACHENGVVLPLELILIFKNFNAIRQMAIRAGFSEEVSLLEAYAYPEAKKELPKEDTTYEYPDDITAEEMLKRLREVDDLPLPPIEIGPHIHEQFSYGNFSETWQYFIDPDVMSNVELVPVPDEELDKRGLSGDSYSLRNRIYIRKTKFDENQVLVDRGRLTEFGRLFIHELVARHLAMRQERARSGEAVSIVAEGEGDVHHWAARAVEQMLELCVLESKKLSLEKLRDYFHQRFDSTRKTSSKRLAVGHALNMVDNELRVIGDEIDTRRVEHVVELAEIDEQINKLRSKKGAKPLEEDIAMDGAGMARRDYRDRMCHLANAGDTDATVEALDWLETHIALSPWQSDEEKEAEIRAVEEQLNSPHREEFLTRIRGDAPFLVGEADIDARIERVIEDEGRKEALRDLARYVNDTYPPGSPNRQIEIDEIVEEFGEEHRGVFVTAIIEDAQERAGDGAEDTAEQYKRLAEEEWRRVVGERLPEAEEGRIDAMLEAQHEREKAEKSKDKETPKGIEGIVPPDEKLAPPVDITRDIRKAERPLAALRVGDRILVREGEDIVKEVVLLNRYGNMFVREGGVCEIKTAERKELIKLAAEITAGLTEKRNAKVYRFTPEDNVGKFDLATIERFRDALRRDTLNETYQTVGVLTNRQGLVVEDSYCHRAAQLLDRDKYKDSDLFGALKRGKLHYFLVRIRDNNNGNIRAPYHELRDAGDDHPDMQVISSIAAQRFITAVDRADRAYRQSRMRAAELHPAQELLIGAITMAHPETDDYGEALGVLGGTRDVAVDPARARKYLGLEDQSYRSQKDVPRKETPLYVIVETLSQKTGRSLHKAVDDLSRSDDVHFALTRMVASEPQAPPKDGRFEGGGVTPDIVDERIRAANGGDEEAVGDLAAHVRRWTIPSMQDEEAERIYGELTDLSAQEQFVELLKATPVPGAIDVKTLEPMEHPLYIYAEPPDSDALGAHCQLVAQYAFKIDERGRIIPILDHESPELDQFYHKSCHGVTHLEQDPHVENSEGDKNHSIEIACATCGGLLIFAPDRNDSVTSHALPSAQEKLGNHAARAPRIVGRKPEDLIVVANGYGVMHDNADYDVCRDRLAQRRVLVAELQQMGYSNIITAFSDDVNRSFHTAFDPHTKLVIAYEIEDRSQGYPEGKKMTLDEYLEYSEARKGEQQPRTSTDRGTAFMVDSLMRRASRGDEEALVQLSGHLERGVTPEVAGRDCYDADAAIAAGILDKGFVHLSSGLYTVKVNTDKVKEEEIARLEEMVEAINKKMGRKMIRVERTKDINTTHQFECKRRGKVTVSKVNVTPHKDARDRTLAILNLGLAASTIPDDIKDVTPYKALIAYINEQYKSLNLNGRILIENPEDPEEIIEKLHGSIINVILPPVRRQDFEKFEELDMQMQALDRAA